MKTIPIAILVIFLFSFSACNDEEMDQNTDMTPDKEAPLVENLT